MKNSKIFYTELGTIISTIMFIIQRYFFSATVQKIQYLLFTDPNELEYVIPEDVGYSSQKLEEAKQFAEQSGFNAVMALV